MSINVHEKYKPKLENPFIYRGVVEDNIDPDKAGRVKIRIIGIHSDNKLYVETSHLPWAIPATDIGISGGGLRNIGNSKVPDIGSHVWVFFEAGDHNYPVYFASAPAIEDVTNYQEKGGRLDEDGEYIFDKKYQFDDDKAHDKTEKVEEYFTALDDKVDEKNQVQDWSVQTRFNTYGSLTPAEKSKIKVDAPEGLDKENVNSSIFPDKFFQENIRIAFDGKANHDSPQYDGIEQTKTTKGELTTTSKEQELNSWTERKWGYNDHDAKINHLYKGDSTWTPTYPMCSTQRNAQGEIIDTDILKERRTYIHPSKYFIEYIQLDADRTPEDFQNETSIKRVYERQRGVSNSPSYEVNDKLSTGATFNNKGSSPITVELKTTADQNYTNYPAPALSSNSENPVYAKSKLIGRGNNSIVYDDVELKQRTKILSRFEERKHNPGREKTVVEDFVYRFYMNKVNETYVTDHNVRIYRGNRNVEVEHGDENERYHRGSKNSHIDDGNYNTTVNRGWHHTHIDHGHQFVEIYGKNPFTVSISPEKDGNPNHNKNQHSGVGQDLVKKQPDAAWSKGADNEGCDAKFKKWTKAGTTTPATGENDIGNQFFLLHKGHQILRLEKGHQHTQINDGHQKLWIKKGHQTHHIEEGDQRFQLDKGNIERYVDGERITLYTKRCKEKTNSYWQFIAADYFMIKAPEIILDGNVRITGTLEEGAGEDSPVPLPLDDGTTLQKGKCQ